MTVALRPADCVAVTWTAEGGATGDPRDDQDLVARAREGDAAAITALYRRYVDRIYRFAYRRMGTHHRAEEVTAATFERALRALPEFVWQGRGFEPWLFRIAANECAAWFRREHRSSRPRARLALVTYAADETAPDAAAGIEDAADAGELAQMRRALTRLNPRYQEVISLRYFSDLSTEEAAAAMGCSKAVLSVTLHRAVSALQRALARDADEEGR